MAKGDDADIPADLFADLIPLKPTPHGVGGWWASLDGETQAFVIIVAAAATIFCAYKTPFWEPCMCAIERGAAAMGRFALKVLKWFGIFVAVIAALWFVIAFPFVAMGLVVIWLVLQALGGIYLQMKRAADILEKERAHRIFGGDF